MVIHLRLRKKHLSQIGAFSDIPCRVFVQATARVFEKSAFKIIIYLMNLRRQGGYKNFAIPGKFRPSWKKARVRMPTPAPQAHLKKLALISMYSCSSSGTISSW